MKSLGYTASFLFVIVFSTIFSGYAFSVLWDWFVVSTFNVPSINISTAIGLALVVQYLTHQWSYSSKTDDSAVETLCKLSIYSVTKPTVALAIGWIVTFWL